MAKSKGKPQPTRSPKVSAPVCPQNKNHKNTRVYKTKCKTRYCICDDCGKPFKTIGEEVDVDFAILTDELRLYFINLADDLETFPTVVEQDGTKGVLLADELRTQIVGKIRQAVA